jgi:hypothetical protein
MQEGRESRSGLDHATHKNMTLLPAAAKIAKIIQSQKH